MALRIAIGPFDPADDGATWPLYGAGPALRPDFEIVPFAPGDDLLEEVLPDAAACVVWSPEYQDDARWRYIREAYSGLLVACLGDWHIRLPALSPYDLVATDLRGTRLLRDRGLVPAEKLLWFRMFSHDPRLHFVKPALDRAKDGDTRDLDVAFMGRDAPGRADLLERVRRWAAPTRAVYLTTHPYRRGREAQEYRRARIVLGHSQRGELQMRAYEAMACGALYVCAHDTEEVYASHAPIPTYEPAHLEPFLESWLDDEHEPARHAQVRAQQEWVAHETPARHLRWLCRRIADRLPT